MTEKYKSDAFEAIHSEASDLFKAGGMDQQTMREFDELCLVDPRPRAPIVIITDAHDFRTIRPEDTPDEILEALEQEVYGFVCESCHAPTRSLTTIQKDGKLHKVCPDCYSNDGETITTK
jgi:hypothetical protein